MRVAAAGPLNICWLSHGLPDLEILMQESYQQDLHADDMHNHHAPREG